MIQNWHLRFLHLGLMTLAVVGTVFERTAIAQITPDQTLGAESSRIRHNATIRGGPADVIEGGATRNTNLFHSFQDFNVQEGQRVYFADPTGITNIFSRVTGSNPSNILGALGVDGAANLFLLNPNGILFGANASLDIEGSFFASTASGFTFADGNTFSATTPQALPVLTVSVPLGVQYGANSTGAIASQSHLSVGQDLTLAASNLDLHGQLQAGRNLTLQAQNAVQIRDSATVPFIATAGHDLVMQGNQTVDIAALNHPDSGLFAGNNLTVRSATPVIGDAHYGSGGNFRIEQLDGNLGDLFSPHDPVIRATGDVRFNSYTGASLHILAGGSVIIPGTVSVTGADPVNGLTETVTLSDGTPVVINGRVQPTVDIRAGVANVTDTGLTGSGSFTPLPAIDSNPTSADIQIGTIFTPFEQEGRVLVTNQYRPTATSGTIQIGVIDTSTGGVNGGLVAIDARNTLTLTGRLNASSSRSGNGGDVRLLAAGDLITGGINTSSQVGNGGNINLVSQNGAIATTAGALSSLSSSGNSGSIALRAAGDITVGSIDSGSNGAGTSGSISLTSVAGAINATDLIRTDSDFGISGPITLTAAGDIASQGLRSSSRITGGDISITSGGMFSLNTNRIFSFTTGAGDAGDILIQARTVNLNDASIEAGTGGAGQGGDILIQANEVNLANGSEIGSSTEGEGQGGIVTINASSALQLDGTSPTRSDFVPFTSRILALASGQGNAGNIVISTGRLTLRNGATIASSSGLNLNDPSGLLDVIGRPDVAQQYIFATPQVGGRGGDITINANSTEVSGTPPGLIPLPSRIATSTSSTGRAGDVTITTDRLQVSAGALITTATLGYFEGAGQGGNLTINARDAIELTGTSPNREVFSALSTDTFGFARAGNLSITTGDLSARDGAVVSASTLGTAQGGSIAIQANRILLDGAIADRAGNGFPSGIYAQAFASGNAGNLTINTNALAVSNRATITAAADTINNSRLPTGILRLIQFPFPSSATGDAGTLAITANAVSLTTGGTIRASTLSRTTERRGNIILQAADSLLVDNGLISASTIDGTGGGLSIRTNQLTLQNGARATVSSTGSGTAGDLDINARRLSLNNAEITAETQSAQTGGNIQLQIADALTLLNNSQISASTQTGQGGTVNLNSNQTPANLVDLNNGSRLSVEAKGTGSAGNIALNARAVTIQEQPNAFEGTRAGIFATNVSDQSQSSRGNITLTGLDRLQINNGEITASTATGQAGSVQIDASDAIQLTGSGGLAVRSTAGGNAGELTLRTNRLTADAGAQISVSSTATGSAGTLQVTANQATLSNGALLTAATEAGSGGNIQLQISDRLQLQRGSIISATTVDGQGGNITIRPGNPASRNTIALSGEAQITSDTRGRGSAGSITIGQANRVSLNNSTISTAIQPGAVVGERERVGNITIEARSLTLTNSADVTASTRGVGNAGTISVRGAETVALSNGSRITSAVGRSGDGRGGNIILQAGSVTLRDRAQINSDIQGRGSAGRIAIRQADTVTLDRSFISTAVGRRARTTGERVGDIDIEARSLLLNNNATITANTAGRGNAGNINIQRANTVSLANGAGISTAVRSTARGQGGSITVQTNALNLANRAEIAANSEQRGRNAGNINVLTSGRLRLSDSDITTSAAAGTGGSINLTAATVELRGDGDIRTNVSSGVGGGGNITIKAGSAIAFDDSDILAFAVDGRGGDINLGDTLFFGENYQPAPPGTNPATLDSNGRVDVNASGTVDGTITFPDVSLIQNSLSELPQVLVNPDQLLANSCIARSAQRQGSFTVTGVGGLPTRPETVTVSLFPTGTVQPLPDASRSGATTLQSNHASYWQPGTPIVEPQGVYQLPDGRLVMSRDCSE
jgi:filamentous hemagglutinin family protein